MCVTCNACTYVFVWKDVVLILHREFLHFLSSVHPQQQMSVCHLHSCMNAAFKCGFFYFFFCLLDIAGGKEAEGV